MAQRVVALRFGRHVHPVYREQLHAVPPGWRYVSDHPGIDDQAAPTKLVLQRAAMLGRARERAESVAMRALSAVGYVHHIRGRVPAGAALVHAAERLLWRSPVPYVVDLEHVELFVLYQRAALDRPWARRILERALLDERLRFLLPWSEAARRSVLHAVSSEVAAALEPKLRVVHPAVRPAVERTNEPTHGSLRVLFVGTKFYEKGAVEAIRAVREARASHDVELDLVSFAPESWAREVADEAGIRIHQPGGSEVVRRLYEQADVLLFPSHMDTYGVVVGEAMAHGVPVLAPRHLALTEIVRDGESGLLFEPENMLYRDDTTCAFAHTLPPPGSYVDALRAPSAAYVTGIATALARLSEEPELRGRLATGALRSVREGHLSMTRRREALAEIYDQAAG